MQDIRLETLLNVRCIIILQQLMLLLLAISLFTKVQLLLPEFFRFLKPIDWPMEQTFTVRQGINVKEKEESIVLLSTLK